MGRIRTIKPDFFLHEDLAELSPLHRLLFIGLWTLADKEGRLEDRPKRIKAALLPWEDCDVSALMADLSAGGFIQRYEVAGISCIAIPSFGRHQRCHPKEAAHGLPDPPEPGNSPARNTQSSGHPVESRGKGREGDLRKGREGKEISDAPPAQPPLLVEASERPADLQALWNELAHPDLPRWAEMTDKRRRVAASRLRDRSLAAWREVVERISASPFCRGANDRGWRASPDWLLQPDTAAKVLEGKYDPRAGPADPRRGRIAAEDIDPNAFATTGDISHGF